MRWLAVPVLAGIVFAMPAVASASAVYQQGWLPQAEVGGLTDQAPALASCESGTGGAMLVFKRAGSTDMYFRKYTYGSGGGHWGPEHLVGGGGGTSTSPTVGCSRYNTYWVAWKGIGNDTDMYYTKTTDGGETWQTQQLVGGGGSTNTRPSLVATEYQ